MYFILFLFYSFIFYFTFLTFQSFNSERTKLNIYVFLRNSVAFVFYFLLGSWRKDYKWYTKQDIWLTVLKYVSTLR